MSKYLKLNEAELKEHRSSFLILNWSVSKVNTFARNQKVFEMQYLYNETGTRSATTVGGSGYHTGAELFFKALKDGVDLDIVDCQVAAFQTINATPINTLKLQKTTPSIESVRLKAIKTTTSLINHFYKEQDIYLKDLEEVLFVEKKFSSFLTINGVDIPIPCVGITDLIIRLKDGRNIIIDHKSKAKHSDEKEATLTMGKQAITYVKLVEASTDLKIDEVWFIENKHSKNKNNSPQLVSYPLVMNEDNRKLYEFLLYEPLKKMIEAVSDADYTYIINDYDMLVDQAELYEFWCKTQTAEINDFNIDKEVKPLIEKRLKKIKDANLSLNSNIVKKFKTQASKFITYNLANKNMTQGEKISHILRTFSIDTEIAHTFEGYSSKTYLLRVGAGTSVKSVKSRSLDIANAINVSNVRISPNLTIFEGESFVSVEADFDSGKTLLYDNSNVDGLKIPIGVDNYDNILRWDLNNPSTPHALICGGTGSGKTVAIISIVTAALKGGVERVVMFDPKFEFSDKITHPRVTVYTDIDDIELAMAVEVEEMNDRVKSGRVEKVLMVFDEFADAILSSRKGSALKNYTMMPTGQRYKDGALKMKKTHTSTDKSLAENNQILLQKGRSSGLNIISATQRASVKIINGDAKVNYPIILCFAVQKEADSRVVLDESGAEMLKGRGDGLMKSPLFNETKRFQSFYIPQ